VSIAQRFTGLGWRDNAPIAMVGLGHAATHWVAATFYLLLPAMSSALNLSYTEVGTLVSVMHISSFSANFFSGPLVDMTGRRVLWQVISLVLGALALAAFGLAGGILTIAALVVVIGMTNNLWHPPAISYISQRFPNQRGYALSIHALGASFGDTIAPIVAGVMLTTMTWQGTASASVIPVFGVALMLLLFLGRAERQEHKQGAPKGMNFNEYLTGLGTVLRNRAILGLAVMSGFRSMTQNGLMLFLPLYVADVLGGGPLAMGLALSAMQAGGLIATPIAGVLSDRIGRRPVVLMGLGSSTVVIAALTVVGNEVAFVAGVSLLGFVLYAVRPVAHSWLMDLTPPAMGGSATSLMFGTQTAFSVSIPIVGGMIADQYGLQSVFYLLAATVLASNLITLTLPKGRPAVVESSSD
jgi:MFS family permease